MGLEPFHRGIFLADIERSARSEWTDPIRVRARERLHRLLDDALAEAAIDPRQTDRADTGDGVLLVTAEVPITRLAHSLPRVLTERLAADNKTIPAVERLRLRLVVHAGGVIKDAHGYSGAALTHASRLLDAQAGRAVLDAVPEAQVVLLVSDHVYDTVIKHGFEDIDPASYQPVQVQHKETRTRAWVHLPGQATQPDLAGLAGTPPGLSVDPATPLGPPDGIDRPQRRERRRRLVALGGILLAAVIAGLAIWRLVQPPDPLTQPGGVITVYNKITNGATAMQEDNNPAYLSTVTQNACRRFGCALPGTEMSSDAKITAVCQIQGDRTTNGSDGSTDDDANPNLNTSRLWYGIRWSDGRFGYISEVWIQASDRGGLGLPDCPNR